MKIEEREPQIFVVIDAKTLELVLDEYENEFANLTIRETVKSVLCCRVTPKQKGRVVAMVKSKKYITLAIGDGGNDVPMIQEAHIGVGIKGKEGMQASRAADYSLAKFKFLARLVLVHGHWSYHRTCYLAQYSFYRCFFFCMFQLSFNTVAGYSGASWFLSLPIAGYNVFTGLPTFMLIMDRDVSAQSLMSKQVYSDPSFSKLYQLGQNNEFMNWTTAGWWLIRGVLQGIIVAWLILNIYGLSASQTDGTFFDIWTTSLVAYSVVILIQCLVVCVESHSVTRNNHITIWGMLAVYILSALLLGNLMLGSITDMYGMTIPIITDMKFWLSVFLTLVVALFPVWWFQQYVINYKLPMLGLPKDHEKLWRAEQRDGTPGVMNSLVGSSSASSVSPSPAVTPPSPPRKPSPECTFDAPAPSGAGGAAYDVPVDESNEESRTCCCT